MSRKPKGYEVGYGKPPKATRFQKGQSGNLLGRPKGSRGLKQDLERELNIKVQITENGELRTVTKQRLLIKQLTTGAAKGDQAIAFRILDLLIRLGGDGDQEPGRSSDITKEDQEILSEFLKRVEK